MQTGIIEDPITQKIKEVLRPLLRFLESGRPVPSDENLRKLWLDSMAAINLLFDIEQAFGVQIPDDLLTAETFETAASLDKTVRPVVTAKE